MTILCVSRPRVKPNRKTARPAAPFGAGLEPTLTPALPTSCRIVENDHWSEDRDSGVDDDACRYELEVFVGSKLVASRRSFSLSEMRAKAASAGREVGAICVTCR